MEATHGLERRSCLDTSNPPPGITDRYHENTNRHNIKYTKNFSISYHSGRTNPLSPNKPPYLQPRRQPGGNRGDQGDNRGVGRVQRRNRASKPEQNAKTHHSFSSNVQQGGFPQLPQGRADQQQRRNNLQLPTKKRTRHEQDFSTGAERQDGHSHRARRVPVAPAPATPQIGRVHV